MSKLVYGKKGLRDHALYMRAREEREAMSADIKGPPLGNISIGEVYRHLKTGGLYTAVAVAEIEATLEAVVVYRAHATGRVWVRPLGEFIDGRFAEVQP